MNLLIASVLSSILALPPVMPPEKIVRGQRGECHTVFEGNTVEPFPFVVKGVMNDFLGPGKDLVLVRLEGDKAEFTGVVAGMSGSPCSIDGKLVGALAYAFSMFAKEPIAGITPYESMADVLRLPVEDLPWRGERAIAAQPQKDWLNASPQRRAPVSDSGLQPIRTPLALSGVPQSVHDTFAPWLQQMGFEPVAGGGLSKSRGRKPQQPAPTLVPGGAVSAILVRGDVNIAATGTVTSVEGGRVLAFGHPFMGVGAISIPMAQAEIINTMASSMRSFKMALTGPVVGELTQDRLTAIGGVLGDAPQMIPVTGALNTPSGPYRFQFEVARDVAMTPRLIAMALASALQGRVEVSDRGIARVRGEIRLAGKAPIEIRNVHASQRDGQLFTSVALDIAHAFALLWDTPFGAPPDAALHVQVDYDAQPIIEWIDDLTLDRALARPGETITVHVHLRQDDGPARVINVPLTIPTHWRDQKIDVIVASAAALQQLERNIGGVLRPTTTDQIATWVASQPSDGFVYIVAVADLPSLRSGTALLSALPPSAAAMFGSDPSKEWRSQSVVWRTQQAVPGVVSGMVQRSVRISAF